MRIDPSFLRMTNFININAQKIALPLGFHLSAFCFQLVILLDEPGHAKAGRKGIAGRVAAEPYAGTKAVAHLFAVPLPV